MNRFIISVFIFILLSTIVYSDQFSLYFENDLVYHTDMLYTHGTRAQYTYGSNFGISVGQNIYTPLDKENPNIILSDRPYAGYLYGSVFNTTYFVNGDERFQEIQLGVIGPYSYAEQTQKWVHEKTHSALPMGWDNQIPNHFAILLLERYTTHIWESKYFAIDPYAGVHLGNLEDEINAGFNVYAGYNLPATRNQQRVIPFKEFKDGNSGWNPYGYIYLGLEPKLIAHNMLLDDSRFDIHPNTYVYDRNAGMVLGCKYFELAFTFCLRSKEFDEQPQDAKYGAVKLSFGF